MTENEARQDGEAWGQAAIALALSLMERATSDAQVEAVVQALLRTLAEKIERVTIENGAVAAAAFRRAATQVIADSFGTFETAAGSVRTRR